LRPALEETYESKSDSALETKLSEQTPVIIVMNGGELGRRYHLKDAATVIGRDPGQAHIVIQDRTVSAMPARIDYKASLNLYSVTDLDSRNGLLVNSQRIAGTPLNKGDKIFIGSTILKFTFEDAYEHRYRTRLDELMNIDELTGLPVKRVFDREFQRAFDQALIHGTRLSMLMMDMDGLKRINDTYGHLMGSKAIAEVGKLTGKAVGGKGMVCRYGGDEFIAFVRNRTLDKTQALGERIRERIASRTITLTGHETTPSISIGVAEKTRFVLTPTELILIADEALYRAKAAGRNVVSR
jgi:diguanylate cyclase (GGDEF)-like protein